MIRHLFKLTSSDQHVFPLVIIAVAEEIVNEKYYQQHYHNSYYNDDDVGSIIQHVSKHPAGLTYDNNLDLLVPVRENNLNL